MRKFLPQFLLATTALVGVGFFFAPHEAHAFEAIDTLVKFLTFSSDIVYGTLGKLFWFGTVPITSFVLWLVGMMIDLATNLSLTNNFFNAPAIATAWSIIRDLCNMVFIFVLIWAGLRTILNLGNAVTVKKTITGVVIAALFIIAIWVAYDACFVLRSSELGLLTRLGTEARGVSSPGLHFKLPFVTELERIDGRVRLFESKPYPREGAGSLELVRAIVAHRVEDALAYRLSFDDEARLGAALDAFARAELAESPAASSMRAWSRPQIATRTPSATSASAAPNPRPDDAPATAALRPAIPRSMGCS